MKSFLLGSALLLILAPHAMAVGLSFAEIWQKIQADHPLMQIGEHEAAAGLALREEAGFLPNPELGFTLEDVAGSGPYGGTGLAETSVVASQRIERGSKRAAREQQADSSSRLQQLLWQQRVADLHYETRLRFIAVLAARERVQQQQAQSVLLEKMRAAVTRLHQEALASAEDLARVSLQQQEAKLAQYEAQQQLAAAGSALAALWGDARGVDSLEGDLISRPQPEVTTNLSARLREGIENRLWQEQVRLQRAGVAMAQADKTQDVTVSAGFKHINDGDDYAFTLGASMPLPLFNDYSRTLVRAQSLVAREEAEARVRLRQLEAGVLQAQSQWRQASLTLTSLDQDILPAARELAAAIAAGYRQGRYGYLQVLEAQRSLVTAEQLRLDNRKKAAEASAYIERFTASASVFIVGEEISP